MGISRIGRKDGDIYVFDAATDEALSVLFKYATHLMAFDFSRDGGWIVGGCPGCRLTLWDAETGTLLSTFPVYGSGVAFRPDGEWLAVGVSWDIHLYRVETIRAMLQ